MAVYEMEGKKHVKFAGRLVFVGFGSVGQGSLPLLLRHIDMPYDRISIVTGDERGRAEAAHYGIKFQVTPLTRENYRAVLEPLIGRGDFLLNLSVDVSSVALIELAYEKGAMYLDTCIEPWLGGYTDPNVTPSHRSNYGLREAVRALRTKHPEGPTVIPTHGANPGLISHWVKQAMINIAGDIEGKERLRVDRCTYRWCRVHLGSVHGWVSRDALSFGQEPRGPWTGPVLNYKTGGPGLICLFEGRNYTGDSLCYPSGTYVHDLLLLRLDNRYSSVQIEGNVSVTLCRDRDFASYCERINDSEPRLHGFLDNNVSSVRIY